MLIPSGREDATMPKKAGIVAVMLIVGLAAAQGQTTKSESEILNSPSPSLVRSVLKSIGVQFVGPTKEDDTTFNVTLDGQNVTVITSKIDLQVSIIVTGRGASYSYHNYYYSGKAGVIQIMTFTKPEDMVKYEKELTEFVNGFHVNE
jgi:hypothetical protein